MMGVYFFGEPYWQILYQSIDEASLHKISTSLSLGSLCLSIFDLGSKFERVSVGLG